MLKALIALIPSAGVLFLFVIMIRAMLEGDRRERSALARWEAERDAAEATRAAAPGDSPPSP